MKRPNPFLKRVAGVNVLLSLGTAPKPPEPQMPTQAQALQSQWAKNEKANALPRRRNQARELGYQLREPKSGEYRRHEELGGAQAATTRAGGSERARDSHDKSLSEMPSRGDARREAVRKSRQVGRDSSSQRADVSRGREANGR
jgi:pyruvate/2-oxoglutarate dehydrogenase complex dihydrolipoamide acyltransferase (E2) component